MTDSREPYAEELPDLFAESIALDAEARRRLLDSLRAARPALAARLEELLAADRDAGAFLERPLASPGVSATLATGDVVEGFRVEANIASGANGSVYRAVQDYPRRTVALKVLHFALPSPGAVARFRQEVRTLARLSHPGIVPLFAAGVIDPESRALPWFAMELIDGARDFRAWARDQPLTERVRGFTEACDAVHHAHLKGVVHRDLKPGNILVGADSRPRVIDFGVATSTGSAATLATHIGSLTPEGAVVGTLAYMSPEQLDAARDIDGRADIYALGVILYETCTGRLPFDFGRTPAQALRAIAMDAVLDPVRAAPQERALRGDLAAVILRAIERDPARRYQSTADFAADLRRWLGGEPVLARRPRFAERAWRAARRRPVLSTAVALTTLGAIGITVTSVIGAGIAYREAMRAQRYITGLIIALEDPSIAGRGREARMADAADAIIRGIEGTTLPADEEADGRMIAGRIYELLAIFPESIAQYERALALRTARFGQTSSEALETLAALARAAAQHRSNTLATNKLLDDESAAKAVASAFRALVTSLGWRDPRTLDAFAWSAPALDAHELRSLLRAMGDDTPGSVEQTSLMSIALRELAARGQLMFDGEDGSHLDQLVQAAETVFGGYARVDGVTFPAALAYELSRPRVRVQPRAEAAARRLIQLLVPIFMTDRVASVAAPQRRLLAISMRELGDPVQALALLEVNMRIADVAIPFGRQTIYSSAIDASRVLADLGRSADGEAMLARAVALPEPAGEDRHTVGWRACALAAYASCLREAGRDDAALEFARRAREAVARSNLAATTRVQSFTRDVEYAERGQRMEPRTERREPPPDSPTPAH